MWLFIMLCVIIYGRCVQVWTETQLNFWLLLNVVTELWKTKKQIQKKGCENISVQTTIFGKATSIGNLRTYRTISRLNFPPTFHKSFSVVKLIVNIFTLNKTLKVKLGKTFKSRRRKENKMGRKVLWFYNSLKHSMEIDLASRFFASKRYSWGK